MHADEELGGRFLNHNYNILIYMYICMYIYSVSVGCTSIVLSSSWALALYQMPLAPHHSSTCGLKALNASYNFASLYFVFLY